jgi:hypothetical protein
MRDNSARVVVMDWSRIDLPTLAPRYDAALQAALVYIFQNFEPFGVIVSGSIVRGNPDPSSDLDIVVLHEQSWRRRIQKWFEGVPAEIFVNSPAWIKNNLAQETSDGRPVMAHMLTTGAVVFSSSARTMELIELAQFSLAKGPNFSDSALERQRYGAACLFEDALEVAERDPSTSALILGRAAEAAVSYWFASRQRFSVRSKEQMQVIRAEDRHIAELIDGALLSPGIAERVSAARELVQGVIGHTGFFEWDSGPSEMNGSE